MRRFGVGGPWFQRSRLNKGQAEQMHAWAHAVRVSGVAPIPLDQLFEVSRWAVRAGVLAREGGGAA
jgi:hypothetical protein